MLCRGFLRNVQLPLDPGAHWSHQTELATMALKCPKPLEKGIPEPSDPVGGKEFGEDGSTPSLRLGALGAPHRPALGVSRSSTDPFHGAAIRAKRSRGGERASIREPLLARKGSWGCLRM